MTFVPGCHARCPGQQPTDVLTLTDDPTTAAASAAASTATATTATAATTTTNRRVYPTEAPVHSRVITQHLLQGTLTQGENYTVDLLVMIARIFNMKSTLRSTVQILPLQ